MTTLANILSLETRNKKTLPGWFESVEFIGLLIMTNISRAPLGDVKQTVQFLLRSGAGFVGISVFFLIVLTPTSEAADEPTFDESMRERIEDIRRSGQCVVARESIAALELVSELYENNGFQPLWTSAEMVDALMSTIRSARQEGLIPNDYHYTILSHALASPDTSPVDRVGLEVLLSDAFFRLAYHFRFGKIDPEEMFSNWNFSHGLGDRNPLELLNHALVTGTVAQTLHGLLPQTPHYQGLRKGLARYRQLQNQGGWDKLPGKQSLKPGITHPHVALLRKRLNAEGAHLSLDPVTAQRFDSSLEQAVRTFQRRHGIKDDGIVGPKTLAELNIGAQQRIDQIRVNLERLRWVSHSLPGEYLLVDIAGYRVLLYRNGKKVWSTRAVVGRPYRKTPIFRSTLRYLVINPTWTVPPTILRRDIMPKLKHDRSILQEKNLQIIDAKGKVVDPETIDWKEMATGHFPYQLRQPPGPDNALGRIKFMFPNTHFVYLHDTPSKSLFDKTERAFSSGCIRIEKPIELAGMLLEDNRDWSRERLLKEIDTRQTKTVNLKHTIPVLIMYFTAEAEDGGPVNFRPDLYHRDSKVLLALNQ